MRIVQAGFMPVVALGFSVAPVAGQNFGARQPDACARRFAIGGADGRRRDVALDAAVSARAGSDGSRLLERSAGHRRRRGVPAHRLVDVRRPRASSSSARACSRRSAIRCRLSWRRFAASSWSRSRCSSWPARRVQLHWMWYISVAALVVQLAVNQLLLFREFGRRLTFASAASVSLVDFSPRRRSLSNPVGPPTLVEPRTPRNPEPRRT